MASDIWMGRLGEFDDSKIISRLWGPCNLSPKRARASENWEKRMSNYNNTKWPDLFEIVQKIWSFVKFRSIWISLDQNWLWNYIDIISYYLTNIEIHYILLFLLYNK